MKLLHIASSILGAHSVSRKLSADRPSAAVPTAAPRGLSIARGGLCGEGAPAGFLEHAETYLRGVFGFVSATNLDVVTAEGLRMGPDQRAAAITTAEQRISLLAA